jgi:hypothetical protein
MAFRKLLLVGISSSESSTTFTNHIISTVHRTSSRSMHQRHRCNPHPRHLHAPHPARKHCLRHKSLSGRRPPPLLPRRDRRHLRVQLQRLLWVRAHYRTAHRACACGGSPPWHADISRMEEQQRRRGQSIDTGFCG